MSVIFFRWAVISATILVNCRTYGLTPISLLVKSFALHLPNLTNHLNSTIGHSDAVLALGLDPAGSGKFGSAGPNNGELSTEELHRVIPNTELNYTLEQALIIAGQSAEDIKQAGWKLIHKSEMFSLYKRRSLPNNQGPVEYLMTGKVADVSPRTFLHSQINCECRKVWDKTMKDMSSGSLKLIEGIEGSEDSLYYRTKWPWPLKDRDYTLARRCRIFEDKNALVFVSRSAEMAKYLRKDGVIRVDNYWCHSALFSNWDNSSSPASPGGQGKRGILAVSQKQKSRDAPKKPFGPAGFFNKLGKKDRDSREDVEAGQRGGKPSTAVSCLDMPGMSFISVFCDDQKVPLHPRIIDMIAHQVS